MALLGAIASPPKPSRALGISRAWPAALDSQPLTL